MFLFADEYFSNMKAHWQNGASQFVEVEDGVVFYSSIDTEEVTCALLSWIYQIDIYICIHTHIRLWCVVEQHTAGYLPLSTTMDITQRILTINFAVNLFSSLAQPYPVSITGVASVFTRTMLEWLMIPFTYEQVCHLI